MGPFQLARWDSCEVLISFNDLDLHFRCLEQLKKQFSQMVVKNGDFHPMVESASAKNHDLKQIQVNEENPYTPWN